MHDNEYTPFHEGSVAPLRALFERLRKLNLRLSRLKVRLGTTDADFLGHTISPAGVRRNMEKSAPNDQTAHATGSEAGLRIAGRCGVLLQIPACLVQVDRPHHLPPQEGSQV